MNPCRRSPPTGTLFVVAICLLGPAAGSRAEGDEAAATSTVTEGTDLVLRRMSDAKQKVFKLVNEYYLFGAIGVILISAIILGKKKPKRIAYLFGAALALCAVIKSVDYVVSDVLKPHQQSRVKALINPDADPLGAGWNVTQSKIAIGSGGFLGKGFLQGTQTKFNFVPEQSTAGPWLNPFECRWHSQYG